MLVTRFGMRQEISIFTFGSLQSQIVPSSNYNTGIATRIVAIGLFT